MAPLLSEDTTPDISGQDNPGQALSRKEMSQAQKQQAQMLTPPPQARPQGGIAPAPQNAEPPAEPAQPPQEQKPQPTQSQSKQSANGTQSSILASLPPEQQQYFAKVAENPWMPIAEDLQMGGEALWNLAHHVGAGWNALADPNAMSLSQQSIWSRNDALAKLTQLAEAGPYGQFNHGQSEWFWENFGGMITSMPAYLNPLSGTALLGLSAAGAGPQNPKDIPSAVAGGLPLAELGTVIKHPEDVKDPQLAARLFWKSANALLIGASVLPMTRWLKGLNLIDPKVLEEMTQSAERVKALQPGDPNKLPDGKILMNALDLPPMGDRSLVSKAPTRDIRQMEAQPGGGYADLTAKQRGKINKALGIGGFADLPHVAPDWTPAQVKLASKVLPGWLPYDLTRVHSGDVVPENPHKFLDQTAEAGPAAMRYLNAFNHVHAQILRGPTMDPLNAAESMVHSLPAVHTGTQWITDRFFGAEAELMQKAGLKDSDLMRAIRDPKAYEALAPAGKIIVNSQKILRRVYAQQARAFGHREGFVPNYDPRVRVQEEAPIQGSTKGPRSGPKGFTTESKASRQERFIADPENPEQIALAEAHPDVFSLNAAMREMRAGYVANATKSGGVRNLETKSQELNAAGDWYGSGKALEEAERRIAAGTENPSPAALAEAQLAASRRYPLYHEGLHEASVRSLPNQIMALHSHIGLAQVLNALAHDGNPLAFERTAREIPAGYRSLTNASKVFDNYVFHPDLANPLNRISEKVSPSALDAWVKTNQLSVAALMFSPMIHGDNMLGRMAWLLGKHPVAGAQEGAAAMAHSKPWAMLEQVLGVKHADEASRIKWQMNMEMQAINAGVIPHFPSKGLSNLLFSEYGKAIGDSTAFEGPGTREMWRLPPAFQGIEGAARAVGHGYDSLQNLLWGRIVMPLGIFSYHVERAAAKAAMPGMNDLALDQYAAHMANRWQGAIEPMARSQAMNTLWKSMGFAINWVRSFYELALPSYLSKSAVAAHPEMRGFILRQELQSLVGMLAAQHVSGNLMNMILSGHPQWENDPHNRYYLEITRPDIIKGLQGMGLYKNVNPDTGRDQQTGGKLVVENPAARQQLQMERMLGMEPGTSQMQGIQDMAAGHLAPLVDTLAAAFNINLPQTILAGTARFVDQGHPYPEPPWQANLAALMAQFGGVSSTLGRQQQLDASGRPQNPDTIPPWLQNAPVPDVIKRYAAPGAQQAWNWMTGVRAPYVRVEKSAGVPIPDQNYASYATLSDSYKKDMTDWSNQVMQGKMTPYDWRQRYSARAHDYSVQLGLIFNGAPEVQQGALGLYAGYQKLYNDAQLPDGTGVDWGKLDGLQADFTANLTAAQQADLQTEINKHENAYPALGMYRSTIDAHTQMAKDFAQSEGVSYGTLMSDLQQARSLDKTGYRQFLGQHPEMGHYEAAQTQWEINTWPGRLYSLYYHTAALARWLVPTEGATGPAAEEKAAADIEQHYQAPAAVGG